MEKLYENIKYYREAQGMSQEELAKRTGYTDRSSITKIEKGLVDLQQSKIILFAKALNVPVLDLLGWTVKYTLTDAEAEIIRKYRALDASDKARIEERIDEMLEKKTNRMEGDVNVG
ncbi:MAG: helix-turn-helix domain-containing protein [Clostridia bacterium]|nr:helix-turn-helix domain-containing protein [Clostridia bacterium]